MTINDDTKVFDPCGRCGGDGVVHYGNVTFEGYIKGVRSAGRICFWCNGSGGKWVTQATLDRRAKDRERRARKRVEQDVQRRTEMDQRVAELVEEHPLLAWLTYSQYTERDEVPGFLIDIAFKMFKYELTAKQIAAVERAIEQQTEHDDRRAQRETEKADKIAAGVKAPEGRTEIVGTVGKVVLRDSDWGSTFKMVVRHDDGWAVWLTVPDALISWAMSKLDPDTRYAPKTDDWYGWDRHLIGQQVRLTATLTPADDDPLFAFGSRPAKASVVEDSSVG